MQNIKTLQWRHNERDGVSNHQPHDCLLNRLFRHRSNKTSKLRVTGLCEGNSPVTNEFPAKRASNAENVSIWWRHHEDNLILCFGRTKFCESELEMGVRRFPILLEIPQLPDKWLKKIPERYGCGKVISTSGKWNMQRIYSFWNLVGIICLVSWMSAKYRSGWMTI